jgi:hypothetical protein
MAEKIAAVDRKDEDAATALYQRLRAWSQKGILKGRRAGSGRRQLPFSTSTICAVSAF